MTIKVRNRTKNTITSTQRSPHKAPMSTKLLVIKTNSLKEEAANQLGGDLIINIIGIESCCVQYHVAAGESTTDSHDPDGIR
ncbi:hypothetical protein M8J75_000476 [Diaphorina citri]|nr:hypothetical protein M8J75_000476 [Diaphorina citri]KAI5755602.1 hypothetical protein M8J77_018258 [Diaphorina citri]